MYDIRKVLRKDNQSNIKRFDCFCEKSVFWFFYVCHYVSKGEIIYYLNDYNGGTLGICDYLFERIKRGARKKTIQQSAYLLVKGLIKKKGVNRGLFNYLDDLFDIPKPKEKPQKTKEELIDDFENYIKGV